MNIFHQLVERPWVGTDNPAIDGGRSFDLSAATVGLRMFLCIASVLFSLLVITYADRMLFEDWRPTPSQWILWFNTGLLIQSSIAFQWSLFSIRRDRVDNAKVGMLVAGLFAVAFLIGQILAWRQMITSVEFDITNPAVAFFYLITALHALHMMGGLVAWRRTAKVLWQSPNTQDMTLRIRLCTTYWHFLLIIWLILFGLLFSDNDNLNALLVLCGLR